MENFSYNPGTVVGAFACILGPKQESEIILKLKIWEGINGRTIKKRVDII